MLVSIRCGLCKFICLIVYVSGWFLVGWVWWVLVCLWWLVLCWWIWIVKCCVFSVMVVWWWIFRRWRLSVKISWMLKLFWWIMKCWGWCISNRVCFMSKVFLSLFIWVKLILCRLSLDLVSKFVIWIMKSICRFYCRKLSIVLVWCWFMCVLMSKKKFIRWCR